MNNDIYFPIRSNLEFFESKSNQPPLIDKIKNSILIYDNLLFDDGAYELSCNDRGSFELPISAESMHLYKLDTPEKPRNGCYFNIQGEPNGKLVNVIPPTKEDKNYTISFRNLIENMTLHEEKFIKFNPLWELNNKGKDYLNILKQKNGKFEDQIESYEFCKKKIFENFFKSFLMSVDFQMPMMVDSHHDNLLKSLSSNLSVKPDFKVEIFKKLNEILKIRIPDFSPLNIDEILDLRKEKSFLKFRGIILKINQQLSKNEFDEKDEAKIFSLFYDYQFEELKEIAPTGRDLALDGFLFLSGFIPTVGSVASAASYGKDVKEYLNFKNTSLAFIMKYREKK